MPPAHAANHRPEVLELLSVDDFEYDAFAIDKAKVLRHHAA
jgi:acyl-CoA dehydrogenase